MSRQSKFLRDRVFRFVKVVKSGGPSKDPGYTHVHRRQPKPLLAARGVGSINFDADLGAVLRLGAEAEAAELFEQHQAATFKGGAWKRSRWLPWFTEYKARAGAAA